MAIAAMVFAFALAFFFTPQARAEVQAKQTAAGILPATQAQETYIAIAEQNVQVRQFFTKAEQNDYETGATCALTAVANIGDEDGATNPALVTGLQINTPTGATVFPAPNFAAVADRGSRLEGQVVATISGGGRGAAPKPTTAEALAGGAAILACSKPAASGFSGLIANATIALNGGMQGGRVSPAELAVASAWTVVDVGATPGAGTVTS